MDIHNDLTFFTNEPERNLYDRFNKILTSNTKYFDILVGYFRTSGFYLMYPSMENVKKIRILVGINVDKKTVDIIQKANDGLFFYNMSHKEVKQDFTEDIITEMQNSEDSYRVEQGVKTFINWLKSGKLEIRIYPEAPIHAKVYILRKDMEKVPDQFGSVITGSSNFSQAGLANNLEFNVELKDSRDVHFALEKFENLWEKSIDITAEYIDTISEKTWLKDDITPYNLFLKTLYEYFKEEINEDKNEIWEEMLPDGFMNLQYQTDAVIQAKKILEAYNGVFIADVVGLGKTFICAMLAQRLNGRKLVICPPVLKEYWERTLQQFDVSAKVESLGKLDSILNDSDLMKNTKYVFIDEAHRFRNEKTDSFQKLHEICYNKKVILVTATPQNNYYSDIANQIYLFQPKNNSTIIPNQKNLEAFFKNLDAKLKKHTKGTPEYARILKNNSAIIRDKVLRNIMIRRTRNEIMEYYQDDLEKQGLTFPELGNPEKIVYIYDEDIEKVFNHTVDSISNLSYARYLPLTYLEEVPKELASLVASQKNMAGFMKSILIKRLESSFEAFKKSLHRFIKSYEKFLAMCEMGEVYISKNVDVYDLIDNSDDEKLIDLVEKDIIQHYPVTDFRPDFIPSIKKDLFILKELQDEWEEIIEDPKKDQFLLELKNNDKLIDKKIIIFTESRETAEYVGQYLNLHYPDKVLVFSGQSSRLLRQEIEANFNPNYIYEQKNEINFLVTTDILAEGINLHRSNVIINYDLPWNPTKVMQRVGRINRVGTKHDNIYVFNFFPAVQAKNHLSLEENITLKMQAFHDTLGEDFKYLTDDEEISSHNLYTLLTSKDSLESEAEEVSELKYLKIIRDIRDNDENLYQKIKLLPRKSKSGRIYQPIAEDNTITFLRKGSLKKFFLADSNDAEEIYFLEAMRYLEVRVDEEKVATPATYFEHLELNKLGFALALLEDEVLITNKTNKSGNDATIIKMLKAIARCQSFTDVEEQIIQKMGELWEEGHIPSSISKEVIKQTKGMTDPVQIYYKIYDIVPEQYFTERKGKKVLNISGDTQVILSSYLKKGEGK